MQAAAGESELAFMDDESGLVVAGENAGNDLVEGNHGGLDIWREQLEREIRRGHGTGYGDGLFLYVIERERARGDHHGAVALAYAAAAGEQRILLLQVGIGVKRDR